MSFKVLMTLGKLLRMMAGRTNGAQGRNRTTDTRIFNPLLYHLSYLGTVGRRLLGKERRPVQSKKPICLSTSPRPPPAGRTAGADQIGGSIMQ